MRILVVGNGGREHVLLWKLSRDAPEAALYATRPNAGMADLAESVEIAPGEVEALAAWSADHAIDLTVVGPEAPLAAGIVDRFQEEGLPVFGPTAAAARIESSKAFAKELMVDAGVPTAEHATFSDPRAAVDHIRARGAPIVVKASGLAAGKGSIVCTDEDAAVEAVERMMEERAFGAAGSEVVVEEFMRGEELSVFALTDGEEALLLMSSQDHKRVGEGDRGPNTGGMGAYAPVSVATPGLLDEVRQRVLRPTLRALAERGAPFRGLLYAGLMLTDDGPKVVEFNCRFGDPEAQVVIPLMASSLLDPLLRVAEGGSVADLEVRFREGAAVVTVLASEGYPGSYPTGRSIRVPEELREEEDDILLFHAGTRRQNGYLETAGGRVLGVTGLGDTLSEAAARSRLGARQVEFQGKYFRSDIGWRELARDVGDGEAGAGGSGGEPAP